jgi:hypothetical protein
MRDYGGAALESFRKRPQIELLKALAIVLVVASAVVVGLKRRKA